MRKITIDFIVDSWVSLEEIADALKASLSFTKNDIVYNDKLVNEIIRDSAYSINMVATKKEDNDCISIRAK